MTLNQKLFARARELNKAIVNNFFAECDLHVEARSELGVNYIEKMAAEEVGVPSVSEAKKMRQVAKATHLRKSWLMGHLPPKVRQLAALAAIPNNSAGEKFMRDAVKDGALCMSMSPEKAVWLREMFKARGFYDPGWSSADSSIAQAEAASQSTRIQWVSQLKAKYPKEFEANSMLEHMAEMCVPWGVQEESLTPQLALETFKMNKTQSQDAATRMEKILNAEKKAVSANLRVVREAA